MHLHTVLYGIRSGDFHPGHAASREAFLRRMQAVRRQYHLENPLYAPTVAFSNRVVRDDDFDDRWSAHGETVLCRTREPADGANVIGRRMPVTIFNGDCPLVCLYDEEKQLAVLHGGYRCLIREDDEPNILDVALGDFDPSRTRAWVGYGIGPCCWVPEPDKTEIADPARHRHAAILRTCLRKTTDACPLGAGHLTVDLTALAVQLLTRAGVLRGRIAVRQECTCCARDEVGSPRYWSHTRWRRDGGVDGRNMALAWLEE